MNTFRLVLLFAYFITMAPGFSYAKENYDCEEVDCVTLNCQPNDHSVNAYHEAVLEQNPDYQFKWRDTESGKQMCDLAKFLIDKDPKCSQEEIDLYWRKDHKRDLSIYLDSIPVGVDSVKKIGGFSSTEISWEPNILKHVRSIFGEKGARTVVFSIDRRDLSFRAGVEEFFAGVSKTSYHGGFGTCKQEKAKERLF